MADEARRPPDSTGPDRTGPGRKRPDRPRLNPRLNRDDWIGGAVALLAERGVNAVRIEPLARRLGVTKGSFYWHFRDRPALLAAILARWEERQTDLLVRIAGHAGATPAERLRLLLEMTVGAHADREFRNAEIAIRNWSRNDPAATVAVRSVDARRSVYIENFFIALGFSEAAARTRAGLFQGLLLGEALLVRDESDEDRTARVGRSLNLLAGRHRSED